MKNEVVLTAEETAACMVVARSIYGHIVSLLGPNLKAAFAITIGVAFALAAKAGLPKERVQEHLDATIGEYEPVKETLQ